MKTIQILLTAIIFSTQLASAQNLTRYQQQKELFDEEDMFDEKAELELGLIVDHSLPVGIESSNSEVSSTNFGISASYGIVYASYINTQLDWDQPEDLPFGNGLDEPLEEIHQIDLGIAFGDELNDQWGYGFQLGVGSALEDDIDDSLTYYLGAAAFYQLTDDWAFTFGAGVEYDKAFGETDVSPWVEISWLEDADQGFSFTVGLPETSVSLTYNLSANESISLEGVAGGFYSYLADDTTMEDAAYMEAESTGLGLSYSRSSDKGWSFDYGVAFLFGGEIVTQDEFGDDIDVYDIDDGIKLSFGASYAF